MATASSDAPARVTLLTRTECHLCDDARRIVATVCTSVGQRWKEVDIDGDAELRSEYTDQVPVVLVDGEQIAALSVEPSILQQALVG